MKSTRHRLVGSTAWVVLLGSAWIAGPAFGQTVAGKKPSNPPLTASITADPAAQDAHRVGPANPTGALFARRGAFVRAGVELSDVEACELPSLLLQDSATGQSLRMPLLSRPDGLALTQANADALAAKAKQGCYDFNSALQNCGFSRDERSPDGIFQGTLGAGLTGAAPNGNVAKLQAYQEAVRVSGTPFYTVVVESVRYGNNGLRASLAVWLPEHLPVGAYNLGLSCGAGAVGTGLPLVVLFNPLAVTTQEAAVAGAERDAALGGSDAQYAGPLRMAFGIDANDVHARDVALQMLASFPLAARANPALVARIAQGGPMQLLAQVGVKGETVPGLINSAALWQPIKVWNDATGHFDLWDGSGAKVLWGRWDGQYLDGKTTGIWVSGLEKLPWAASTPSPKEAVKGLVGRWEYDTAAGQDTSAAKGTELPHDGIRVTATVHFVDDWQGETAYLKGGGAPVRFGQAKDAYTMGAADDAFFAKAGKTRAKYGQCWVYAATTAGATDGGADTAALSSGEVFAAYKRDGGGRGICTYGRCFCAAYVGEGLLRSLGIPTRSATNFDSAHESRAALPDGIGPFNRALVRAATMGEGFATVDFASWAKRLIFSDNQSRATVRVDVQPDGRIFWKAGESSWNFDAWNAMWPSLQKTGQDTVWNFHVWSEAWSGTPVGSTASRWNAYDGTPQEASDGKQSCGADGDPIAMSACKLTGTPYLLVSDNPAQWFAFAPYAAKIVVKG